MGKQSIYNNILENIQFTDLFDMQMIQDLQDNFALATGVASIITYPDGRPITKPSNFCRLCIDIIRNTPQGLKNCYYSDSVLGRQNYEGPIYQKCLSGGLWDGGASITVGDKHIANWLIGQVKNKDIDENKMMNYAKEIGADEAEFKKALDEVTTMPLEQFKRIADSLFMFAKELSDKAFQNLQLKIYQESLEHLVKEKTDNLETAYEELQATNNELFEKNETISNINQKLSSTLENLKETQSQLVQAEKMASLGILTAGIAHEINNPLNFIMGAYMGLGNYFERYGSEDFETTDILLESIKKGVDRASAIVNGLNQFSRNTGNYDEICDIHYILDNCLVILHNQIKSVTNVQKQYSCDLPKVLGNVGKLHQVFINILTNSIQAIQDNGQISISTRVEKDMVIIEFSDNGSGISKENLKYITDPFFTTKEPGKGTGLGLSISYSIIQEHKGKIEFESEPGIKTLVRIVLPGIIHK